MRCISNTPPFPHQFREPLHVDEQWKLNPGKVLEEEKNIFKALNSWAYSIYGATLCVCSWSIQNMGTVPFQMPVFWFHNPHDIFVF